MNVNYGKKFEHIIHQSFAKVAGVSIDRLHDQTSGFRGSQNICDFIVYKKPYEYYIECKSVHGNTLPFSNITDTQWEGLYEKSKIAGVQAGIICWWIDRDITKFVPILLLEMMYMDGKRSIRYDEEVYEYSRPLMTTTIKGKKKRIFYEYDMEEFLNGF